AQTATAAVSIQVAPVLAISSSGAFTFPVADDAHYQAGEVVSISGPTLTHRGNVPYRITIEAQSGSEFAFTPAAGRTDADPAKPVSDLTGQPTFGGTDADAAVGAAGAASTRCTLAGRGGSLTARLTARTALSYEDDPPGTYAPPILFSTVAQ